ncbi:hypothetical protein LCGC14_0643910 [marine sediment metagenome]|uniref:Uncharacterized protein n=1 Tax=marine sediment metagenome TaxID=412755 RepID=A0A0F9RHU4_9ZZZZ
MLTYRMMAGPHAGQMTADVEEAIRWLTEIAIVTPEHAQMMRDETAKSKANAKSDRNVDRVIDAAAAKFEDRETE